MNIYTSRYQNKALITSEHVKIGASVGYPQFKLGYDMVFCPWLGPDRSFKGTPIEVYEPLYLAKLNRMGARAIMGALERISATHEEADIVLLCYEDTRIPSDWCHRRMLAAFLEHATGRTVLELDNPQEPKIAKPAPAHSPLLQVTFDIEQEIGHIQTDFTQF